MRFTRRHLRLSAQERSVTAAAAVTGVCGVEWGVEGWSEGSGIRVRAGVGGAIRTRAAVRDALVLCCEVVGV